MARPGDPADRPQDTAAVAFSTEDMDHDLNRLSMHGLVAWLGKDRPKVEPEVIKKAICHRFGVRPEDVTVVKHFPEDYYCDFKHRHQRDEAAGQGRFSYGSLDIHTRPWQLVTHGDICDLKYHVRLCLEGIPLHAWNESIAKRAVARACDLLYVEQASANCEDTRALCLWAWTHNPSDIPKVTWLTLSCRKAEFHNGPPARGRRGLTFRVLVHLDLVEDPPGRTGHNPPREYTWRYGVIDVERVPRDRNDPPPSEVRSSNRRDNDDDDYDRRGRHGHRSDTWGSRLLRNLSRAPRDRERKRSESRRGSRRHQSPERGGRRRPLHRADAASDPTDIDSTLLRLQRPAPETPRQQVMDANPARPGRNVLPAEAARRPGRGRSRERTPHRRHHRQARSESPQPRHRCKSPDLEGSASHNRHPSPSAPKVRADHEHIQDLTEMQPPPVAPSSNEPAPQLNGVLQYSTVTASSSSSSPPHPCSVVLQEHPSVVHDPTTPQREARQHPTLPADRRFRPGQVYSRRTRADTLTRPNLAGRGQAQRFRPGCVYTRRRIGAASVSGQRQSSDPIQVVEESVGDVCGSTMSDENLLALQFVTGISQPLPQPLLQVPSRCAGQPQRHKRAMVPARRSVRIAARSWPRGDTQAKARQVLMKKLGICDGKTSALMISCCTTSAYSGGHSRMLSSGH